MELQALAALGYHDNIVGYNIHWFENEQLYIQMKPCDQSLSINHSSRPSAEDEVFEAMHQLLPGNMFNIEAQRQALRNLDSLSLFSNIEVHPLPDEKQEGGIVVWIRPKEDNQTKVGDLAKFPIAWH